MAVPNPPVQAAQPTPPQRSDPSNFAVRADAWHTWFSGWTTTLTSIMGWVSDRVTDTLTNATAANDAATAAATSKTAAATSATNSASSATASASSASAANVSATNSASSASASASSASAANASAVNSASSATASAASAAQAASSAQAATSGGIRFDTAQNLNAAQITQARANLGSTAWSINITGNAATAGTSTLLAGYAVNTSGVNNQPNQIVKTDASGYVTFGWINTTSGDNGRAAIARIYASNDAYLRFYTPANFITALNSSSYARESNGGTLSPGTRYSIYTGSGALSMSLPASSVVGDEIEISNLLQSWATYAFTITCPANCRINSVLDNLVCNHNAGGFTLVCSYFDGSTYFWTVRT